jgi:hypothetical protein
MPYIKQEKRASFENGTGKMEAPGDVNYILTRVCSEYINNKGKSYQTYNDIIGALECCKLEMYRRAVAPYEELKIAENGDVF